MFSLPSFDLQNRMEQRGGKRKGMASERNDSPIAIHSVAHQATAQKLHAAVLKHLGVGVNRHGCLQMRRFKELLPTLEHV
jgi:hypothetical protein